MFLGIFTLFVAVCISGISAYYSIIGLTTLYAAAFWPIIYMGSALELGKITTTILLHTYWDRFPIKLKTYLIVAVVGVMLLTSMGVFGYLTRAYTVQTSIADQNLAKIESIEEDLVRQEFLIERAEDQIQKFETQGSGRDVNIQTQIDREQERIDRAYERIQPQIDRLEQSIAGLRENEQQEIELRQNRLSEIDSLLAQNEIEQVQRIIGVVPDGVFGPNTRSAIENYRTRVRDEIQTIRDNPNPDVRAAREEIQRLRDQAANQVRESSELIDRLRSQLGNESGDNIAELIQEQQTVIDQSNELIEELTEQKFVLETESRMIEAEVGPVKYIAEMIYGDADRSLLEDAMRIVTILIVVVFDPLAICLVLAGSMIIGWSRKEKKTEKVNTIKELQMKIEEYERLIDEISQALEENANKIDSEKYSELQSRYDELQKEKSELKEKLKKQQQEIEDLADEVVQLNSEVERRDKAVIAMAEKYQLVKKDTFSEDIEKDAKQG